MTNQHLSYHSGQDPLPCASYIIYYTPIVFVFDVACDIIGLLFFFSYFSDAQIRSSVSKFDKTSKILTF